MFATGLIPSPLDERDYQYRDYGRVMSSSAMPREHIPALLPRVRNQGAVGSCVAFASMALRETQELRELGRGVALSRNFAYHYRPNRYHHQGEGMVPREHLGTLQRVGAAPEPMWPGNHERGRQTVPDPLEPVLKAADAHRIDTYTAVQPRDILEFKSGVFLRDGVIVGAPLYANFYPGAGGVIPKPSGDFRGNHMMLARAWVENRWLIENSYGDKWGPGATLPDGRVLPGYCWMDWEYPFFECWTTLDKQTVSETRLLVVQDEPTMFVNERAMAPVDLAPFLVEVPGGHRFVASMRHIIETALGGKILEWGTYPSDHHRWPGKMWFRASLKERPWV